MTELDPGAKALFDVARDALGPPADAEARIFSKLGAAAGISVATLAASTSAAGKPVTLLAKFSGAVLQLLPTAQVLPIAAVALSGTAFGVWSYTHAEPPAQVVVAPPTATTRAIAPRRVPAVVPALASALPAVASAVPVVVNGAARPVLSAVQRVVAAREPVARATAAGNAELASNAGPRDAQTAAEIVLIRDMQTAWRSGNDAPLRAAIAEHRARFPRGVLSEEREALSAMLGCRQSPAEASVIGASFAARYARSAYEARVSAACTGKTRSER